MKESAAHRLAHGAQARLAQRPAERDAYQQALRVNRKSKRRQRRTALIKAWEAQDQENLKRRFYEPEYEVRQWHKLFNTNVLIRRQRHQVARANYRLNMGNQAEYRRRVNLPVGRVIHAAFHRLITA
jgi:hypothetical protein